MLTEIPVYTWPAWSRGGGGPIVPGKNMCCSPSSWLANHLKQPGGGVMHFGVGGAPKPRA